MPSKVLVADDSPTIRRRATSTLSEAGYEVTCVEDGQAAWAALEASGPSGVLLCDILMPGLDGYELCRKVKGDARFAGMPVLLLRGTFEPWDQTKAVDVGADGYVTKPFDAEALLSTLAEVLADGAGAAPAAPEPVAVAQPAAVVAEPLALPPEPLAPVEPLAPPPEPLAPIELPMGMDSAAEMAGEPEPLAAEPLEDFSEPTIRMPAAAVPAAVAPPPLAPEPAPLDESPFGEPDAPGADDDVSVFGGATDEPLGVAAEAAPLALPDEPLGALGSAPAPAPAPPSPAPVPVAAAPARPVPAAAPAATVMSGSIEIDDALIERIAARVAARLTAGELERVAWDVVPDVAEALIRKRLGEIEAQLGEG